jgi:hypothetical protein
LAAPRIEIGFDTSVLPVYLESFGNPRRFGRIARRITKDKPVVAVKSGRTAAGHRAASSHTGALLGDDAIDVVVTVFGACWRRGRVRSRAASPPPPTAPTGAG